MDKLFIGAVIAATLAAMAALLWVGGEFMKAQSAHDTNMVNGTLVE